MRGSNLARHRMTHLPISELRRTEFGTYTYFRQARRPLLQSRRHETRYDEVSPRGHGPTRFRIYRLRGGELQLLAAAPSPQTFGLALVDLKARGEFIPDDATGVLDTAEDPGGWIVHPFALGRTRSAA